MGICSFRETYVPTLKYFLVITCSLINTSRFFGYNIEFQIFSKKFALFVSGTWNFFRDQYSFIVPTFNYLQVVKVRWNFLHSFLPLIPRNAFESILKFQMFFEKLFHVLNSYFSQIFRNVFVLKFQIFFEKLILVESKTFVISIQFIDYIFKALWNWVHRILSSMPCSVFRFIPKVYSFRYFFVYLYFIYSPKKL